MNIHLSWLRRFLLASLVVSLALPFALRAAEKSASYRAALESITADDLLARDKVLADEKFEGREAGTPGGAEARKFLLEQFAKFKLQPAGEEGKFEQPVPPNFCNVVGVISGRDPSLKNEYVLVEAHYDHVGRGEHHMSFDPGGIHPGADDNASGTSGVIELAEAFSFLGEPPKRSVIFLATDGEEKGLVGSKHWATGDSTVPIDKVVAGINMDMIGYLRDDNLYVYGTRTGAGWRRLIGEQNEDLQLNVRMYWDFVPNSDAHPLFEKGIPMLLFHTGVHENYHRVGDTPDKLNAPGMGRVVRLAFRLLHELAERPDRLAYREGASRENSRTETQLIEQTPAPPARLGVTLDTESNDDSPGIRLVKIDADSPAARAGLNSDDRILDFAGREVKKIDDLIGAVMTAESPVKAVVKSPKDEKSREIEVDLPGKALRLGVTWRVDEAEPKALILAHVVPGTPAALAGLQPGDRVYRIAGRDFADENEFLRLAGEATDSLDLLTERNGQIQVIRVNLKSPAPLKRAA